MAERLTLPVLPLRKFVLFPGVTAPIAAGRPETLKAIEAAMNGEEPLIFAVTQHEPDADVSPENLYTTGTIARIAQVQRSLTGTQLLLHGERRGVAVRISPANEHLEAIVREVEEMAPIDHKDAAYEGLYRELRERAMELGQRSGLPTEVVEQVLASAQDAGRLADLVAGYTDIPTAQRQMLLETLSVEERLRRVLVHVQRQLNVLEAQEDIKSQVQEELGGRQREMYLREQLKAIEKELGEGEYDPDVSELKKKLDELTLPEPVRKEVDREVQRLGRMGRESMESQVIRTFLETVAELPWSERSEEHLDLKDAAEVLDRDHYGLEDVKDRVLEFLAVRKLQMDREAEETNGHAEPHEAGAEEKEKVKVIETIAIDQEAEIDRSEPAEPSKSTEIDKRKRSRGPILLFVGPPGVGKTSIAQSIAKAMGREYVRISLGGVRDEADIRGHRRTYVGAMPGRIIQGMKQAGTKNPVFLLDEVDKVSASYQGNPAAALLEVLDPAQNDSFTDHYLGVPFDLSEVLFIATANFIQNIPGPLLDRMETVEFAGYTEQEKLHIARQYLLPRQLRENGLTEENLTTKDEAIQEIISRYTREAGVRQLERSLGMLARKVARKVATGETRSVTAEPEVVRELLGRPKIHPEKAFTEDQVGVATGMYYTPVGGDIMFVEASTMEGKGELVLTGQLGDVMKESARAAWTYARSHAEDLQIDGAAFKQDVHVHVPAGAIPKDGPSAGVTMATALVSALSGRPVRHDVAMTGEITLSGRVLPIGGVKEKVLGAQRAGIHEVILPKENESHLEDLPEEVVEQLTIHFAEDLGELLALTLRGASFREGRLFFASDEELGRGAELPH
jgi:ATP-dependent Lon protease